MADSLFSPEVARAIKAIRPTGGIGGQTVQNTRPIRSDEGGREIKTRDDFATNQFKALWGFVANSGNPLLEEAFEHVYDTFQDREREIETLNERAENFRKAHEAKIQDLAQETLRNSKLREYVTQLEAGDARWNEIYRELQEKIRRLDAAVADFTSSA